MLNFGALVVQKRKSRGLRQCDFAVRARMAPAQLSQIETGRVSPSINLVERLANALDMDLPTFLSLTEEEKKLSTSKEQKSDDGGRLECIRACDCGRDAALKRALSCGEGRTNLPFDMGPAMCNGGGAAAAEAMRLHIGLGVVPVANLESILAYEGVGIVRAALPEESASVAFWDRESSRPVIVLNSKNTHERNQYRLAYELGSFCLYASQGWLPIDEINDQHRFITEFAASFLMPAVTLRKWITAIGIEPWDWTFDRLVEVKGDFSVSAECFALRLEELGLITPALRLSLRDQLRAYYKAHPNAMEPKGKKVEAR